MRDKLFITLSVLQMNTYIGYRLESFADRVSTGKFVFLLKYK